jgi:hypothetical protein
MTRAVLGVDPGAAGGLVLLGGKGEVLRLTAMPPTEPGVLDWLREAKAAHDPEAFVEEIPTAIFGTDKSSMSKLYGSYMAVRMALAAVGVPYRLVKATVWQHGLSIPPRRKGPGKRGKPDLSAGTLFSPKETRDQWKARLAAEARRRLPGVRLTLATCDAALIALYGRSLLTKAT